MEWSAAPPFLFHVLSGLPSSIELLPRGVIEFAPSFRNPQGASSCRRHRTAVTGPHGTYGEHDVFARPPPAAVLHRFESRRPADQFSAATEHYVQRLR